MFQPFGQFFLVLITSKLSNVIQSIECLHLTSRFITSICDSLEENDILSQSAEIIFALDEIIQSGVIDLITLPQINSNLVMQSHEEELQELIEKVTVEI